MILHIPIVYRAETLAPRQRRSRRTYARSVESFEIREVDLARAPVVFAKISDEGVFGAPYRLVDGILCAPPSRDPRETAEERTEAVAMRVAAFLEASSLDGRADPSAGPGTERMQAFDEDDMVVVSCRDEVVAHVGSWLDARARIVDGRLCWGGTAGTATSADVLELVGSGIARHMRGSHVPRLFPSPVDGVPLETLVREAEVRTGRRSHLLLDVKVLREDLFEECRHSSARHVRPDDALDFQAHRGVADRRRLGRALRDVGGDAYYRRAKFILHDAYDRSAAGGASYEDAVDAAVEGWNPPEGPMVDVDAVVAPRPTLRPSGGPRRDTREGFAAALRAMPRIGPDAVPVVAADGISVLRHEDGYLVDVRVTPDVDFATMDSGCGMPGPSDLKAVAEVLSDVEGRTRVPRGDEAVMFARALRHADASKDHVPIRRYKDEVLEIGRRIAEEFVRHRMAVVDGRPVGRCFEPTVSVRFSDSGTGTARLDCSWSVRTSPGTNPPFMFRLDRIPDALAFARSHGRVVDIDGLADAHVASEDFGFDDDLWNARASACRLHAAMDGRIRFLSDDDAAAYRRAVGHVEAWTLDPSSVEGAEIETAFLRDAASLAEALERPGMEDILAPAVRDLMERCAVSALRLRSTEEPDDGDDVAFAGLEF